MNYWFQTDYKSTSFKYNIYPIFSKMSIKKGFTRYANIQH